MADTKSVSVTVQPDYASLKDNLRRQAQAEADARFKSQMTGGLLDSTSTTPAEKASRAMAGEAPGAAKGGALNAAVGGAGTAALPAAGLSAAPLAAPMATMIPLAAAPMAGMLSQNPAVRGATATSPGVMKLAETLGLGEEYRSLLSDLESRGIVSINPEYAAQAGVSTRYSRHQDSKQ